MPGPGLIAQRVAPGAVWRVTHSASSGRVRPADRRGGRGGPCPWALGCGGGPGLKAPLRGSPGSPSSASAAQQDASARERTTWTWQRCFKYSRPRPAVRTHFYFVNQESHQPGRGHSLRTSRSLHAATGVHRLQEGASRHSASGTRGHARVTGEPDANPSSLESA